MNNYKMKKVILTVSIFLLFLFELSAQTPDCFPLLQDARKFDFPRTGLCLNTVKHRSQINPLNDSVYTGKNLFILPEYESWLVWWLNYNYLSDNKIKPGLFHSPSVAVRYGGYTYKLSFQAGDFSSLMTASTNMVSFISLQASSDLVSSETKESKNFVFDSKLEFGRLRGKGYESYYNDTINFQIVNDTFDIDSRSFNLTFLAGLKGNKPWLGLRLMNYNTPAYQVGKRVPDPRNPNDSLLWADVKDTKFTHFFIIVDPLALCFKNLFHEKSSGKKTQLNLQGHCYTMVGLGFATNDTLGRVMTFSFPFQASRYVTIGPPVGFELDLGLRITTRIGKHKNENVTKIQEAANFRTAIGFRYTNWSIMSVVKKDLQLRSNEFYWGPYLMLAMQF
jgi:hypothetical protein